MGIYISYFVFGLSLAAPIGPINAAQLDKGIKYGFWHAWLVGVGAMVADALYMVLVYMGVVHFLDTPFMRTFLWLFGCFVLIYTGVDSLRGAGKLVETRGDSTESPAKSFLSGFLMSLSSPLTMLFWLGIYGSVLAETAAKYEQQDLLLYSSAILFGILLWDVTMALVASTSRTFLTNRILAGISGISGLSLIGFGLYFGVEAFKLLFL